MSRSGDLLHIAGGCSLVTALLCSVSGAASAQSFPEPSDRNHTIDMYQGAALGSVRIIGMGGTAAATAEGSAGTIANPASPAVRPATSSDTWDWDWHLDSLSPAFGTDYDNNGIATQDLSFDPTLTLGVVGQYRHWGLAISAVGNSIVNRFDDAGVASRVTTQAMLTRVTLARTLFHDEVVVGGGIKSVLLAIDTEQVGDPNSTQRLMSLSGGGLEAGAMWIPKRFNLRVGGSLGLPVVSNSTDVANCDPLDCAGYVVPGKVKVPWTVSAGVALRFGPTRWNRKVKTDWRDEKYWLVAADVLVTGPVKNGIGLEAFGQHQLQPSGRSVSHSIRVGGEYEWVPGRFRVRMGSYWEPSRFEDPAGEDIPGRLHATFGFDWRVWSFHFWDDPYRLRLSVTADGARRFGNSGLSIGFWH